MLIASTMPVANVNKQQRRDGQPVRDRRGRAARVMGTKLLAGMRPYSRGVRSSEVMVVILVTRHRA